MSLQHDSRFCRTHAFVARLFAAYSSRPSNRDVWMYLAESWDDLASIKANQIGSKSSRRVTVDATQDAAPAHDQSI